MAILYPFPNFTPLTFFLYLPLLFSAYPSPVSPFNVTDLLSPFPDLSDFAALLSSTAVSADLAVRSSLTLLAVPNSYLRSDSSPDLPDVLRYHILLEYLSLYDLLRIPPAGISVTTLFQTTGRAPPEYGSVNITFDPASATVTFHSPTSKATLLSPIKTLPYDLSILSLDSLLIPPDLDLMASESRPPLGLNITRVLIDGHDFNVAASMLAASGVASEFESEGRGAGITMFVPTDEAFADLPPSVRFQSLPADQKVVVLRFHVLDSYYPLGSLQSIVNPVQPTLATEQTGAGSFTLNISRVNGSVGINTGIVEASITQTVFDQKPVSIFGVSSVLLPREIFGRDPINNSGDGGGTSCAQPPDMALSPENYPGAYGPSSHLLSPPGSGIPSAAAGFRRVFWGLWCVGVHFHLLLYL